MNNNSFNQCNVCGRQLVTINKSGYKPFQGCSMWDDEHKSARDAYKAAKNGYKPPVTQNLPPTSDVTSTGSVFIVEELQAINKRLDSLGSYLKAQFEKKSG